MGEKVVDLRRILFLILTGGVLSSAALVLFLGRTDPYFLGIIGWVIFALAFLVAIASLFASLNLWLQLKRTKKQEEAEQVLSVQNNEILKVSIRRGVLISLFLSTILILQIFRLLAWWNIIIIAFVFAFTELYWNIETLRVYRNRKKHE